MIYWADRPSPLRGIAYSIDSMNQSALTIGEAFDALAITAREMSAALNYEMRIWLMGKLGGRRSASGHMVLGRIRFSRLLLAYGSRRDIFRHIYRSVLKPGAGT